MENMSVADVLALTRGEESNGFGGSNAFLWVILIFLFFLAFGGGGGLFGNNDSAAVANDLSQVERDILTTSCANGKEILENRYTTQLGFQTLGSQMASCCCETNRNIDSVRAENYKNTCEITNAIHSEGEQTRALITANTIQELRDNLQSAQLSLQNVAQTQNLVNQLKPCPVPAYITCSPYASACGCGCGPSLI